MSNRLIISERIQNSLIFLSRKIEILSSNNELSWNKHAENILIPILNLIFKGNFSNSNLYKSVQMPSIDLSDYQNKIAIQITSTDTFVKIKNTVEKFIKHEFYNDFDTLYIVFIKEKSRTVISNKQIEELENIIQGKFTFDNNNIFDLSKLYNLTTDKNLDDLEYVVNNLEKEIGNFSVNLIENGPVTILIFDDDEIELAYKIVKGLIELDIRVRHFSNKLKDLQKSRGFENKYCQLLFDKSTEAKSTIILGTKKFRDKVQSRYVDHNVLYTLQNQHLKHFLFKLEEYSSFYDIQWIKPTIFISNRENFQQIIDKANVGLRKQSKVSEIQDYVDFETIIKLYDYKSKFAEPRRYSKPKKKIGYTLLESVDPLKSITTYYLYIYKGVNIKQTAEIFFQENKQLKYLKENLILFLSKEIEQKQLSERVQNAQKVFKAKKAFYLDEFVWEYCMIDNITPDTNIKFSSNSNFVIPEINPIEGEISDFDQIENWFFSEYDPILVITGGGGIGKTTMSRVIADKFRAVKTNSNVIFIEASDTVVMNHLIRLSESRDIDLYDFYSASLSERPISRDLFRINIDNGNFLLIIDGLDEVFSRIPDFDVRNFIASISNDFIRDIGVGKILLTCRSYFWKERISKETHINHFEIEPFSLNNARDFFQSKFNSNSKLIEKSMLFVNQLSPKDSDGEQRIMPYVVDVVAKIIESGDELLDEDNQDVPFLKLNLKNDYVVYRIFVREHIKTGQISVEDQIKFFIYFSVFHKGRASSVELLTIWNSHFVKPMTTQTLEALKAHPIFIESNDQFSFRYDFFELFFKSIYISELISIENIEKPSESLTRILVNEGKFGSNLLHEIVHRCKENWNENYILRISELIEQIKKSEINVSDFNPDYINQSISSLFALALMINQHKLNNQTSTNSDLLRQVFGHGMNEIKGLSLVQFGTIEGNIKFNFSNLTFKDCYFDSYEYFWDCTFNSETTFENCTFFNMPNYGNNNSKEIDLSRFINPRKDSSFDEYFDWRKNLRSSKTENIKNVLEKFFKFFYVNGYLQSQKLESVIYKKYNSKMESMLSIIELEKALINNDFVNINFSKAIKEKKIEFKDNVHEEILQFIKEGTPSLRINRLINSLIPQNIEMF